MLLDVQMAVESMRYFAGLALELKGYTVPASTNLHFTERQPYGVVGKIMPRPASSTSPWNWGQERAHRVSRRRPGAGRARGGRGGRARPSIA
jgi:hypothetical protein